MNFGEKLTELRKQNGLSQEELGEKLNVTRQTISKWELGQTKPDTNKLMEISKLFNVDFNQLANDEIAIKNNLSDTNKTSGDPQPRKWLLVILVIIAIVIIIVLINNFVTTRKEKIENNKAGIFEIFNDFNELFNGSGEFDKKSFNNTFEFRIGTKTKDSVSKLIDDIVTNNKTNSEHIISVVFGDINTSEPNEIKDIKKKLGTTWVEYEVSADYDENGYINLITIEEIIEEENTVDSFDIRNFNWSFEVHAGTQSGYRVTHILDDIITNNKTNSKHIISVSYNGTNTIDENEIRNIKKSFDEWTDYEVIFDYDEIGFINKVTITN